MIAYIAKRVLLIIPTLLGIMLINFAIIQFAPGGPIDRILAELQGTDSNRLSGTRDVGPQLQVGGEASRYRGAQGLDPKFLRGLECQFGFDRPAHERFFKMVGDYTCLGWVADRVLPHSVRPDATKRTLPGVGLSLASSTPALCPVPKEPRPCPNFGKSFFQDRPVVSIIKDKLPVSISLGLWMTLISYAISIPLGIRKAVGDGSPMDTWTSAAIVVGYAIPGFLLGVFLLVLLAGGSFVQWFPLRGLTSENWDELSLFGKVTDYLWHITLPVLCMTIHAFATTTLLTKNSFLDEIRKQYVLTARAKGLNERRVLYGHVFRNAMLIVIAGFPAAFVGSFFTGSLLIESVFSLDGLGLLAWESTLKRDYPIVFATLFIFSLIGLVLKLVSDLIYMWVDPRIDFETREV